MPTIASAPSAAGRNGPDAELEAGDAAKSTILGQNLESILGREVRSKDDDMGRIVDLLADRYGRVEAAVVEVGGFLGIGTRKIAVEWSALQFESKGKTPIAILNMSRDQLRLAPDFKPNNPAILRSADE